MNNNFGAYAVDGDILQLPTYYEDPAFYNYSRIEYIRTLEEFGDPIDVMSARKPGLDELEGDDSYTN